jgi:hypothetical protein
MACENSEKMQQRINELEYRLVRLEAMVFPQSDQQGIGQRRIQSNPSRVETGMGPILSTDGNTFI